MKRMLASAVDRAVYVLDRCRTETTRPRFIISAQPPPTAYMMAYLFLGGMFKLFALLY